MAWAFCTASALWSSSASFGNEMNGGAITISQGKSCPWSFERKLLMKSSVSEAPLFIFQLAAKIGLRNMFLGVGVRDTGQSDFGQRCHAGQDFPFEEFEGRAAACGNEGHLVIETELVDGRDGVAAADDGDRVAGGHGLGNGAGALGEAFNFEHAHRAVPDDGFRLGDFRAELVDR